MSRRNNRCYSPGRRFEQSSGGHIHAEWESQPLLTPLAPRRAPVGVLVVAAFLIGVLLGLLA